MSSAVDATTLIRQRGRVKYSLTRIHNFCSTINHNTTVEELSTRLEKVDEAWHDFKRLDELLCDIPGQDSSKECGDFEDKYFECKSFLKREIKLRLDPSEVNEDNLNQTMGRINDRQQTILEQLNDRSLRQTIDVRLPRIQLPIFSGDYKEWQSFQDLFTAAVHNNESLTNAQRLQYLKGSLAGDAAALIRHIQITDGHYQEAWEKLLARYNKKKSIVTSLITTFLEQPAVVHPSAISLRHLADTYDEVFRGLAALGTQATLRDPWLIHIMSNNIDQESRQLWAQTSVSSDFPTTHDFLKFINTRCDALEACGNFGTKQSNVNKNRTSSRLKTSIKTFHQHAQHDQLSCPNCNENHYIYKCPTYKALDASGRFNLATKLALCTNCLSQSHFIKACTSKYKCFICHEKHHSSLHLHSKSSQTNHNLANSQQSTQLMHPTVDKKELSNQPIINSFTSINNKQKLNTTVEESNNGQPSSPLTSLSSINRDTLSILPTAVINIKDNNGRLRQCRALLDSGSQASFISEACIKRLSLLRENTPRTPITGLASTGVVTTRGKVLLQLSSQYNIENKIIINAFILSKITSTIPSIEFDKSKLELIADLQLADPSFNCPSDIDVLIGADHFFHIIKANKVTNTQNNPVALHTIFGYIIAGQMTQEFPSNTSCHTISFHQTDIDQTLRKFWELEEIKVQKLLTIEEKECQQHYKETHQRDMNGKYIVKLPFKQTTISLGNSKNAAYSRLMSMERRFKNDDNLHHEYTKFMEEYVNFGHMTLIPNKEINVDVSHSFYLPHHSVIKHSSTTTKLRVVFDGSCKSNSGVSLNDLLLVGPTIQDDIFTILIRFRKHQIAFSTDVEKMYRQVWVHPEDRDYQRIFVTSK